MTIMRICLTWFPIGLFRGNQYITQTRLIYKKWEGCGGNLHQNCWVQIS